MDDYRAVVADFSPVVADFFPVIADFSPVVADFFPVIPDFPPSSPISPRHSRSFFPVIPAKAGIQKAADNLTARNQALSATTSSP